MAKKIERPRSWRGYILNYLHLPWPKDVTEEQKEQWKKDYEELCETKFHEVTHVKVKDGDRIVMVPIHK